MTTTIRVDSATLSESGKSYKIVSGSDTYYAKADQGVEKCVGQTIEAEVKSSEYKGKVMWWINAFKKAANSAPASSDAPGKVYSATPIAPAWQPLVSNCLAAAITAKTITEPEQLTQWALAAKRAIEAAYKDDSGELPF